MDIFPDRRAEHLAFSVPHQLAETLIDIDQDVVEQDKHSHLGMLQHLLGEMQSIEVVGDISGDSAQAGGFTIARYWNTTYRESFCVFVFCVKMGVYMSEGTSFIECASHQFYAAVSIFPRHKVK